MAEPTVGLREMGRVTRTGGVVAACVWDHGGGKGPLGVFWEAARELDPDIADEAELAGAREGHLARLFHEAGLHETEEHTLSIEVEHQSFEDWWAPYTLGVGPAGAHVAGLDPTRQALLRERCRIHAAARTVRADRAGLGGAQRRLTPPRAAFAAPP